MIPNEKEFSSIFQAQNDFKYHGINEFSKDWFKIFKKTQNENF